MLNVTPDDLEIVFVDLMKIKRLPLLTRTSPASIVWGPPHWDMAGDRILLLRKKHEKPMRIAGLNPSGALGMASR